jgi:hypothetical protein
MGTALELSFTFSRNGVVQLSCCTNNDRFGNKTVRPGACLSTAQDGFSGGLSRMVEFLTSH